jgi:hypothetical protein
METDSGRNAAETTHVTTGLATTYVDIVMTRWEVNIINEELHVTPTLIGMNVMARIVDCIRGGGSVEVRTKLSEKWNMPHDGRSVLLLDAVLYKGNKEYQSLPHGEIPL